MGEENNYKRYKPLIGKSFYVIWIPTVLLLAVATVLAAFEPIALLIMIPTDLFTLYFLVSALVAYVELREESVYIRFGFIIKREIPYKRIRAVERAHKYYADSMLSIKNALDHVNIKYNTFDVISVSVVGNDELIRELERRRAA